MKISVLIGFYLMSIFFANNLLGQTYSTGLISCDENLSVQIDIESDKATITMNGPSNKWFSIGFGGLTMATVQDAVYNTGGSIIDGIINGQGAPSSDPNQDWTELVNTVTNNVRTIVATRNLSTGTDNDYVFSTTDTAIDIIWAYGASTSMGYHDNTRGSRASNGVTLELESFVHSDTFRIYPNPSNDGAVYIKSKSHKISSISVYDLQGRKVKLISSNINDSDDVKINTTNLSKGIYNMIIEAVDGGKGMKRIVIN